MAAYIISVIMSTSMVILSLFMNIVTKYGFSLSVFFSIRNIVYLFGYSLDSVSVDSK